MHSYSQSAVSKIIRKCPCLWEDNVRDKLSSEADRRNEDNDSKNTEDVTNRGSVST